MGVFVFILDILKWIVSLNFWNSYENGDEEAVEYVAKHPWLPVAAKICFTLVVIVVVMILACAVLDNGKLLLLVLGILILAGVVYCVRAGAAEKNRGFGGNPTSMYGVAGSAGHMGLP